MKARALWPGARLAVISPAGAPKAELVEAGVARLEALGYEVKVFPSALARGPLYYAGMVQARLADLHAAFADSEIDGILCTRGGWGSAELLAGLDRELIGGNPKVFVGYSDITSLHTWMWNELRMPTFYGAMVAAEFSRPDGAEMRSWGLALGGGLPWSVGEQDGLRVLRAGSAEGVLTGGCLSILAESLGTPYAARATEGVLFVEDVGTKPYQWDRMLLHLRYAGLLQKCSGIVFGDMAQCGADAEIEASILHALRDFAGPIGIGLRSGHVATGNVTLPLGVRVQLDLVAGNPRMHFLEAAVDA